MTSRWLLLTILAVSIVAKKRMYNLKMDRMEVFNHDYSILNFTGYCSFVNRTTKSVNVIFDFKQAFLDTNILLVRSMAWRNNVWINFSALEFIITAKDFFKIDWFDIKNIREMMKPPLKNAWEKKMYKLLNYMPNVDNYPNFLPIGNFRIDVEYWDSKKKIKKFLEHHLYVIITSA